VAVTALHAVATYLPERRVPIADLAGQLDLTPLQIEMFQRFHGLDRVSVDPEAGLLDLLLAAVGRLDALRGREHQVRYVLHARSFAVVVPYPANPVHELCDRLGLRQAQAFAVTHHACASGLLAIDLAGRLLAADGRPDALALVLAGEKAFTRDAQLLPETSIFGEGASACLVAASGEHDRVLSYATRARGDFDDEATGFDDDGTRYQREYLGSLAGAVQTALDRAGLGLADIELILPHNVNTVSWRRLARMLGIPVGKILLDNVGVAGHIFCADAFVNYQTARERDLLSPGDRYLIAAAGAARGATFSAMVLEH
jgi:3-oxoacyl-[acyl-carrier-protein] synthase-3